jgi:hypothetical protein
LIRGNHEEARKLALFNGVLEGALAHESLIYSLAREIFRREAQAARGVSLGVEVN